MSRLRFFFIKINSFNLKKDVKMSKIAVIYWSGTGNTEIMAKSVLAGASVNATAELFDCSHFDLSKASEFDAFALGCPAMGAEELEDSEFLPMFDSMKESLQNKKVALFGSYGWGDGEWMRNWEESCKNAGISLACDSVIAENAPDEEALKKCEFLGKSLA